LDAPRGLSIGRFFMLFLKWAVRVGGASAAGVLLMLQAGVSEGGDDPYSLADSFAGEYRIALVGEVPGVPPDLGGLTFPPDYLDLIIIGGDANDPTAALYSVVVTRDSQYHITGFTGAQLFAQAPYVDGGVTYGPDRVLFYSRYQDTTAEIGQIKTGSNNTDTVVVLDGFGVAESSGGLAFVPQGFPGAGKLKMTTYEDGGWYDVVLTPDGSGTFDVVAADRMTTVTPGSDGFIFVPPGMPEFGEYSVLINEYKDDSIAAYELDSNGDPIPETRRPFVSGMQGPLGLTFDPLTGDLLVSEYGSDQVFAVRGFNAVPGDINCDGLIDSLDVLALLQTMAELDALLPPGCARPFERHYPQ
jgi:hypothetical protein